MADKIATNTLSASVGIFFSGWPVLPTDEDVIRSLCSKWASSALHTKSKYSRGRQPGTFLWKLFNVEGFFCLLFNYKDIVRDNKARAKTGFRTYKSILTGNNRSHMWPSGSTQILTVHHSILQFVPNSHLKHLLLPLCLPQKLPSDLKGIVASFG